MGDGIELPSFYIQFRDYSQGLLEMDGFEA